MTVRELITKLQTFDPDARVMIDWELELARKDIDIVFYAVLNTTVVLAQTENYN